MKPIASVVDNTVKGTEHTVRYLLVMVQQAQDGRQVEKDLDSLGQKLIQVLKANFELKHPTTLADPKCTWSFPESIRVFDSQANGKPVQGRTLTMRLICHTS